MQPSHFRILTLPWKFGLVGRWCYQLSKYQPQNKLFCTLRAATGTRRPRPMASLPGVTWSKELSTTATFLQQFQQDKEFDVTKNPHFIKYSEKLKDLAVKNPEEYEKKLKELESRLKEAEVNRKKDLSEPPKPETGSKASWPPKTLDEIMKVDLASEKSAAEVEEIWKQHHLRKDGLFSAIKEEEFDAMMTNGKQFPMFIYALPRDDGFEFILSEFSENNVYFTSLQMYQMIKENAQACLTIAHFTEFKQNKGIVLMAGRFDEKFLNQFEAVNLVKQMSLFYGKESDERRHLVEKFNQSPGDFNHMEVVEEYKKMRHKVELFG